MKKSDMAALLALMGLDSIPEFLEDIAGGAFSAAPSKEALTHEAGRIVAAWYSIHCQSVDVSVVSPNAKECLTRFTHPAFGDRPSTNELWDILYIMLSGVACRMESIGKCNAADCADDLRYARTVAEHLAAVAPFPVQPWPDTPRIGTFSVSRTFSKRPPVLVIHAMDVAYRQARLHAAARKTKIAQVADLLGKKQLIISDDIRDVLGPRAFALHRHG